MVALVGARVYQLNLPQTPVTPAVRVQLIDEVTSYHFRGEVDLTRSRVQVDCYASERSPTDPYAAVMAVSAAVNAALSGDVFTIGARKMVAIFREARRVLFEADELRLIRVTQDFLVISKTV